MKKIIVSALILTVSAITVGVSANNINLQNSSSSSSSVSSSYSQESSQSSTSSVLITPSSSSSSSVSSSSQISKSSSKSSSIKSSKSSSQSSTIVITPDRDIETAANKASKKIRARYQSSKDGNKVLQRVILEGISFRWHIVRLGVDEWQIRYFENNNTGNSKYQIYIEKDHYFTAQGLIKFIESL